MNEIENRKTQDVMQTLFFAMDAIRWNLKNCGEGLTKPFNCFDLTAFEYSDQEMKLTRGLRPNVLTEDATQNSKVLQLFGKLDSNEYREGMDIFIYDIEGRKKVYEFNTIKALDNRSIILSKKLKNDFSQGADVIPLKVVQFKFYEKERLLKMRTGKQPWRVLAESATDFHITFFSEEKSVLYRIEIRNKEQLRGYVFLPPWIIGHCLSPGKTERY